MNTQEVVAFLSEYMSWFNCALSLVTAYLLSNKQVMKGRILGVFAAVCWLVYGVVTSQYAFIFTEIIFIFIYAQAAIVFTRKRNEYRRRQELTVSELDDLRYTMSEMLKIEERIMELKENKNAKNVAEIKRLQKSMFSILKETSDKIN